MNRHITSRPSLPLLLVIAAAAAGPCWGGDEPAQPRAPGIETPGYVWNAETEEKLLALKTEGNAARGEISYEVCHGCHGTRASGDVDGYHPRLAGQHASVLIKQLTDVRAGRRDNPAEYPFVSHHVIGVKEIADIATYLAGLPVTPDNGKGPGTNLERGGALYTEHCETCHGTDGEGDGEKFYPRVSGQHYVYLLHESRDIRSGGRRNSNPDMVDAIRDYSDEDLLAVADYMSRLPLDPGQAAGDSDTTD